MDVIGMTGLQEAKLAREAEICYASLAMVTDYDCWHAEHESVTVDQVVAVLNQNAAHACQVIRHAVAAMPKTRSCQCGSALKFALITDPARMPAQTRQKLSLLLDKYLNPRPGQERKAGG
jgi:5'-methylthioadenosine phosphorylase